MPLSYVTRFLEPVESGKLLPINDPNCLLIPKELWRMIDFIVKHGLTEVCFFLFSLFYSKFLMLIFFFFFNYKTKKAKFIFGKWC